MLADLMSVATRTSMLYEMRYQQLPKKDLKLSLRRGSHVETPLSVFARVVGVAEKIERAHARLHLLLPSPSKLR